MFRAVVSAPTVTVAPPACASRTCADRRMTESEKEATALLEYAADGRAEDVEKLLAGGAAVNARNKYGNTALGLACGNGHALIVKLLLGASADPDTVSSKGVPVLSSAVAAGHLECVRSLLSASANVGRSSPRGRTPLHHACRNASSTTAVAILLESGADPNKADFEGFQALHLACKNGHMDAAERVLSARGDPHSMVRGQSALTLARQGKHESIVRLLQRHTDAPT